MSYIFCVIFKLGKATEVELHRSESFSGDASYTSFGHRSFFPPSEYRSKRPAAQPDAFYYACEVSHDRAGVLQNKTLAVDAEGCASS